VGLNAKSFVFVGGLVANVIAAFFWLF
jgi:hypothetical protein